MHNGRPRRVAYPPLRRNLRRSRLAWEARHGAWERVCSRLSEEVVRRRGDSSGKVGLYHHQLYVGVRHKGPDVYVPFDPERIEWVVSNAAGQQLHRTPALMLPPERVCRLQVSAKQGNRR